MNSLDIILALYKDLTELALYYTTFFGGLHLLVSLILTLVVLSPLYFIGVFFKEVVQNLKGGK
ncbi:hypothetical protein C0431_13000 [bacterium]|nr:hypothetical protein [bacterium]